MLYSVYNWNAGGGRGAYDVFESRSGAANGQRPKPRRVGPGPRGPGQQLESLLPILPLDAHLLQTSPRPAGRIAIHHTSPAVGLGAWKPEESWLVNKPWLMLGVGAVGLVLGYRLLHHIARKL